MVKSYVIGNKAVYMNPDDYEDMRRAADAANESLETYYNKHIKKTYDGDCHIAVLASKTYNQMFPS